MKLSRVVMTIAFAATGCVGAIPGSSGSGNQGLDTPGNSPPPRVDVGTCSAATLASPRAWRLTHTQLKNTLIEAVGFAPASIDKLPTETRLEGFANQSDKLSIAPLLADNYLAASDEVAAEVLKKSGSFMSCAVADLGNGNCLRDFVKGFGLKMWRRPITDAEVAKFNALYTTTTAQAGGPEAGLKNVVQAFFMSPSFLYRTEVGDSQKPGAVTALTDHELASALSYMLWDGPPDTQLMDLANQHKLRLPGALAEQAKRLLGAGKAPGAMNSFVRQWLQVEDLASTSKDPIFTQFNTQVAGDLAEESRLFFDSVLFDGSGDRSFRTLFTAPYAFVNERTAPLYGLSGVTGTNLVRTNLDPSQRKGFLTLASFMAGHADSDETGLVSRGRYFREEMLCDHVPPPNPQDAMFDLKKITPDMTGREKFIAHSTNPTCKACHQLFDGLGFAMEAYDPIGRFRTMDKNKMIDPSGSVPIGGTTLSFTNFIDLVDQLSKTPSLYGCFSSQYLMYATGRAPDQVNVCEKQLVADEFARSGYKIDALVMSVVNSPSFMARKN